MTAEVIDLARVRLKISLMQRSQRALIHTVSEYHHALGTAPDVTYDQMATIPKEHVVDRLIDLIDEANKEL